MWVVIFMSWQPVNHLMTYAQLTHSCTCSVAEMLRDNAATVCEERLVYLCPWFQSQHVAGGRVTEVTLDSALVVKTWLTLQRTIKK